jgi:hypothetical protein
MAKNTYYGAPVVNFTAAAALTQYQVVKLSAANTVDITGAGEAAIGVVMSAVASGAQAPVKLFSSEGTFPCIAAGAISAGAAVYTAAAGKVNDVQTGSGAILGYAKEAATADGNGIEIIPAGAFVVAST